MTSPAVRLVEGVMTDRWGSAHYDLSSTGSLLYVPSAPVPRNMLVWVTPDGAERSLPLPLDHYRYPRISPAGDRLIVTTIGAAGALWMYDFNDQRLRRIPVEEIGDSGAVWMPGGKQFKVLWAWAVGPRV